MADAGLADLFLPCNVVGQANLQRLMALAGRLTLSVIADSAVMARGLSAAAENAGLDLMVLVECDTGGQRCAVQSPAEAAELARLIARLPGLRHGGLITYPKSAQLDDAASASPISHARRAAKHRRAKQSTLAKSASGRPRISAMIDALDPGAPQSQAGGARGCQHPGAFVQPTDAGTGVLFGAQCAARCRHPPEGRVRHSTALALPSAVQNSARFNSSAGPGCGWRRAGYT